MLQLVQYILILILLGKQLDCLDENEFRLEENQILEIDCSHPTESPRWFKNIKPEESEEITDNNSRYKIFKENNTLRILPGKRSENEFNFTCVFPTAGSRIIRVRGKPEFNTFKSKDHTKDVESFNVFTNDNLQLICEIFLRPQVKDDEIIFTWYRTFDNGTDEILQSLNVTYEESVDERSGFTLKRTLLSIDNIQSDDRAVYTCEAANGDIKSNSTVTVRVKNKLNALWPFLGIVAEVIALCTIILIFEKRRNKSERDESDANGGKTSASHSKSTDH